MISKSLYSNYFLKTLKKKIWCLVLSVLGFFICATLPVLMTISTATQYNDSNFATKDNLIRFLGNDGTSIKLCFILLAVIGGISAFCYLNDKSKVDFYHSIPISRKQMFTVNFVTSCIPIIAGVLINYVMILIVIPSSGYGEVLQDINIYYTFFENILYFLTTYSITVLCTILCGNIVVSILLNIVALFGLPAMVVMSNMIKLYLYVTYTPSYNSFDSGIVLSPILQIFNCDKRQGIVLLWVFLAYTAVTVGIIIVSYFCYKVRKSENSGMAIAFEKIKLPLRIYVVLLIGFGLAIVFLLMSEIDAWLYFGLIFGVILAHCVSQMVFDFNLRSAFKGWKQMIVILASSLIILTGMMFDVTKYNYRVVKADNIENFTMQTKLVEKNIVEGTFSNTVELSSQENIDTLSKLLDSVKDVDISEYDDKSDYQTDYFEVYVNIERKMLGSFKRKYILNKTEENENLVEQIAFSKENNEKTSEEFMQQAKHANQATIISKTPKERILLEHYDMNELLDILMNERENLTIENSSKEEPVYLIKFHGSFDADRINVYGKSKRMTMPVYPNNVNTVNYIEALEVNRNLEGSSIQTDMFKSISIQKNDIDIAKGIISREDMHIDRYRDSQYLEITDKDDIEFLLNNAIASEFYDFINSDESPYYCVDLITESDYNNFYQLIVSESTLKQIDYK